MNSQARPYRKALTSNGLIYIGGNEHEVLMRNLSITGVLVELNMQMSSLEMKKFLNVLSVSATIDFYLPELRLAGEASIARVESENAEQILLALEFIHVAYDVDKALYTRKAYRKNSTVPGRILLNAQYYDFTSVNVSLDGLMIRISESVHAEEGLITQLEFEKLSLKGKVKLVWVDTIPGEETFIGLQYVKMKKDDQKEVNRVDLE